MDLVENAALALIATTSARLRDADGPSLSLSPSQPVARRGGRGITTRGGAHE
ncbi:hypothetical protein [Streptomyces antimicrobicus]|uniref:Uncharacterized protein n=1 Tax=Streptomyces antimicrobicus TaxID=2883108 RepID=A0ABS8BCF4_9ACTN|nr:hypothetical protein [Streptomyces antimicrobicus]MCB5182206.1 hypothetical protein [Streptomyces antimicrobicus]